MPESFGRRRTVLVALAAAVLAATMIAPAPAAAGEPTGLDTFMRAIGQVESGGRYTAVNASSGAYGKYQIMPFNWPVWARTYLGDAKALQTPENQERVARAKFIDLYRWLGTWERVANWWLTGTSSPVEAWSSFVRRYVDRVMTLVSTAGKSAGSAAGKSAGSAPTSTPSGSSGSSGGSTAAPPKAAPPDRHYAETDGAIQYTGSWGSAAHAGYAGGAAAWSTSAGSSATLAFTGRSIVWNGPVGPTRGSATVYLDGVAVAVVEAYAASYAPRRALFSRDFGAAGAHTLRIVALGTAGHPMVAIDELVVGG